MSAVARYFREDAAGFVNTKGGRWMSYRKMGTASVNGGALDRLAGKVTDTSEALVRNWNARIDNAYPGGALVLDGGIEVDVADASQAVTLEVIHEALFSESVDVVDDDDPDGEAATLKRSFREYNVANQDLMNDVLQMYQRFDTTEVQRREMHRSRLKTHFAKVRSIRRSPHDRVGVVHVDP
jgi:cytochrome P450